jgi:hypothetical protein
MNLLAPLRAALIVMLVCATAPAFAQRPVLQGKVETSRYPDGSAQDVAKSPFLMQRLYLDIHHKESILAGSLRRHQPSIERLNIDFAMWDQVKGSKAAQVYQDCIENYRSAYPHLIAAATLFEQRAPVAEVNQESKVAQKFITAGDHCNKLPDEVYNTNTGPGRDPRGGPPDSGPPPGPSPNYPTYPPSGGYNPPRTGTGSRPPAPGSNPCQPYGPGGYDYCNNPAGTRLPPGCVCPAGPYNPRSPLERQPQVLEAVIPPAFNIFVPGIQNIADIVDFLSTYHPVETAYVGIGIAGGRLAVMLPRNPVQVLKAVGGTRYTGTAATVRTLDANVSRGAPAVRALDRAISRSATQNQVMQDDISALQKLGARDFRVNQQQVTAAGERVGVNRPDLQFTHDGQRYYVEYDRPPPVRALNHGARLMANDPKGITLLKTVP